MTATMGGGRGRRGRPRLVHVTTTDMSLDWLLGPQLRAYAGAGFEVVGISAPGPHVRALEESGITHVSLRHATRAMAPTRDLRAFTELVAVLRELRPDIVHTHNPKPGVYGRVAARLLSTPAIVNTVHGLYAVPDDPLAKRAGVYTLERVAASCSHAELVQNPEDLETLAAIGVPREKLRLLGNGIDLTRFDPDRFTADTRAKVRDEIGVEPDDIVVGVVGRLVWEKGYREVFASALALRRRLPNVRYVVIGPTDPDKGDAVGGSDIEEMCAHAGVIFLGARDDVDSLYTAMDVYLLASYREGFPRSAMEAAAMGLPIVATDIRGCRQVVDDGRTGFLVAPHDGVAIAEAVATLAARAESRSVMGANGRARARQEFDQQRVIDITLDTYDRLLAAASR